MKKIILTLAIISGVIFTGCEEDPIVYNGTAVGLAVSSDQVQVPVDGITETYPVTITSPSSEARTFSLEFADGAPEGGGVTLGSITVPADSYEGTATISFDFSQITLADGETETFGVKAQSDSTDVFGTVLNITYFKAVVCNDATFFIQADRYGGETGFFIEDDMGNVVYTMPSTALTTVGAGATPDTYTEDITLPDGCYVAVVTDSYGDGQVDGANPNGFYEITCSIATFATGGGAFGFEQRTPFCVNQ